ncbi:MAG: fibronectin type III domain-containing protein [Steroidobacteraceae bacterium]
MKFDAKCVGTLLLTLILAACSGGEDGNGSTAQTNGATANTAVSGLLISGQPATSVGVNSAYYFNANATGNTGTLAFSISNKPSWATFNTQTGELTGTPTAAGVYSNVKISVSDGSASAALTAFTITVGGSAVADAVGTGTASATLSWVTPEENTDGTLLNDLTGYVIHYGTDASVLDKTVSVDSAAATSYSINGLSAGTTYYFAISAVNTQAVESEFSSVVSISV